MIEKVNINEIFSNIDILIISNDWDIYSKINKTKIGRASCRERV